VDLGTDGTEVIAIADEGYHFVNWDDGVLTANRTDIAVAGDISVMAIFAVDDNNAPVISGLGDDAAPAKNKTWNWDSDDAAATYRFEINQNSEWALIGDYGDVKTATQTLGDGTYYLHVQAKDTVGNESPVTTVSALFDNTAPTVEKLGENTEDVMINAADTANLTFNEALNSAGKSAVQPFIAHCSSWWTPGYCGGSNSRRARSTTTITAIPRTTTWCASSATP